MEPTHLQRESEQDMKNQEINERVAKLCGWKSETQLLRFFESGSSPIKRTTWFKTEGRRWLTPPNYAESLDACKEFETAMNAQERAVYADLLVDLCGDDSYDPIFAPSITRCEAFLRLKGQWE